MLLRVQETSQEEGITPAGASKAQDTANNNTIETGAVRGEAESDGLSRFGEYKRSTWKHVKSIHLSKWDR